MAMRKPLKRFGACELQVEDQEKNGDRHRPRFQNSSVFRRTAGASPHFFKTSQGEPADESEDAAARQTCDVIRGSYLRRDLLHEKWLSALETGTSMFPGVDELIGERRDGAGGAHERVGGT